MTVRYVALAACALLAASGLSAAEPAAESQSRDTSAQDAKNEKKICKTAAATGNRAKRLRTCLTQSEWQALADGSRRGADEYIRDTQTRTPLPPL